LSWSHPKAPAALAASLGAATEPGGGTNSSHRSLGGDPGPDGSSAVPLKVPHQRRARGRSPPATAPHHSHQPPITNRPVLPHRAIPAAWKPPSFQPGSVPKPSFPSGSPPGTRLGAAASPHSPLVPGLAHPHALAELPASEVAEDGHPHLALHPALLALLRPAPSAVEPGRPHLLRVLVLLLFVLLVLLGGCLLLPAAPQGHPGGRVAHDDAGRVLQVGGGGRDGLQLGDDRSAVDVFGGALEGDGEVGAVELGLLHLRQLLLAAGVVLLLPHHGSLGGLEPQQLPSLEALVSAGAVVVAGAGSGGRARHHASRRRRVVDQLQHGGGRVGWGGQGLLAAPQGPQHLGLRRVVVALLHLPLLRGSGAAG